MPNFNEFLAKAQAMEKEIKELREENEQLNSENSSLTNKVKNLQAQLIALKRTDWLIENENLKKENGRLKQEKQKATTQAQATMITAQDLASDVQKREEAVNKLQGNLEQQISLKAEEIATQEASIRERALEKEYNQRKKRLEEDYKRHHYALRDEYADKKRYLQWATIAIAMIAIVLGFTVHTGRMKWQMHKIDRLEQKLDASESTISKQSKRIDRLSTPDQATLERKINAIDGVGYVLKDPVVSKSARDAASKFVNKKELQELRSELDKSRKAGKVGWWSYEVLKSKLTASENYVS